MPPSRTVEQRVPSRALGGSTLGDRWIVTVDGQDYAYTVRIGDTRTAVAAQLAALLDAAATLTATATSSGVNVTRVGGSVLAISARVVSGTSLVPRAAAADSPSRP